MTGSSLAPIVIPIVVMIGLAVWLIMVLYADGHPQRGLVLPAPPPDTPPQRADTPPQRADTPPQRADTPPQRADSQPLVHV